MYKTLLSPLALLISVASGMAIQRRAKMAETTLSNLACPFQYGGTIIIPPGSSCSQYVSDGTTAEPFFAVNSFFSSSMLLPIIVCASLPTQTYIGNFGKVLVTSQQTASFPRSFFFDPTLATICFFRSTSTNFITTTGFITTIGTNTVFGCQLLSSTTLTCSPIRSLFATSFASPTTSTTITQTQTGFIDIVTFETSIQLISATFTFTTTRTFTTTTTSSETQTFSVEEIVSTTLFTSSTITFSTLTVTDVVETTRTTTYVASTSTIINTKTETFREEVTGTTTTQETACLSTVRSGLERWLPSHQYPPMYNFRAEQLQCTIPFAGNVYNSNPGSSMSTICNVAGGTQLLTDYSPLYTWLWSMVKTWTPCAYATDLLWVGSSAGTCIALQSGTTTSRGCSEVFPVICLNPGNNQTVTVTDTFFVSVPTLTISTTDIVTRTTIITFTISQTSLSAVFITVPSFIGVTSTVRRQVLETETTTTTRTLTGYELTTRTQSEADTWLTVTELVSSVVLTRTVTSETTHTTVDLVTVSTRVLTETVNSCIRVITLTSIVDSTFTTILTNLVPEYVTITHLESFCM